jgi:hypothetical protein
MGPNMGPTVAKVWIQLSDTNGPVLTVTTNQLNVSVQKTAKYKYYSRYFKLISVTIHVLWFSDLCVKLIRTVLKWARHRQLSWANWIHSTLPQPISLRSILISSSHLCLGLPSGLLPSGFPTKTLYTFLSSHACHMSRPPHSPWLDLPNDIWGWVQIMKPLTVHLPPFSCYIILRSENSP